MEDGYELTLYVSRKAKGDVRNLYIWTHYGGAVTTLFPIVRTLKFC